MPFVNTSVAMLLGSLMLCCTAEKSKHEAAHPGTGRVTRRNGASLVNSRSRVALVQTRQAMVTKKGCFEGLFEQETGVRDGKETKECNRA